MLYNQQVYRSCMGITRMVTYIQVNILRCLPLITITIKGCMKDWRKIWCVLIGLSTFTIIVLAVFVFHSVVEYYHTYIPILENSKYFLPTLSYIHNFIIIFYAVIIAINILVDINKDEN